MDSSFGGINFRTSTGPVSNDFLNDLQKVKKEGQKSIEQGLIMLGTLIAGGSLTAPNGVKQLDAPNMAMLGNVDDFTLRLGLIQDALDQLQKLLSKEEIKGRLTEMNRANKEQLEQIQKQAEKAAEAAKKNAEAQKKSNIFEAIANWFQAIVSFISAAFQLIAAVGYALVNPAAAAGLVVAAVASFAAGVCQTVLAIDATIRAAGGKGFLDETHMKNLQTAAMACSMIALGASLISGLALVSVGLKAAAQAATQAGLEAGRSSAGVALKALGSSFVDIFRSTSKEIVDDVALAAAKSAFKQAFQSSFAKMNEAMAKSLEHIMKVGERIANVANAVGQITTSSGRLAINDIRQDAAQDMKEAMEAEAKKQAIEAMITALRKLIEQLQADLEKMLDQSMQTISIIFGALDDSAKSIERIHGMQTA